MVYTMKFMQKIIVHNGTNNEIKNIVLKHNGAGASSSEIKSLKAFKEDAVELYTLRLIKDTDLILQCTWNGNDIEKVIYKKLSSNDLRIISIFLKEEDGKLKYSVVANNDVER